MGQRSSLERTIRLRLDAGDLRGAATAAFRGYGAEIHAYLWAVLRDEEAANDVFSQFCENLWKSLARFRGDASFRTWAYRLAWCAAQDFGRQPHRRRERRLETSEISRVAEEVRSATRSYLKTQVKERFARIKEHLSPAERSLILLRVEKGLPWSEVAEVMAEEGAPLDEAAIRKRYERLKKKLRELAVAHGVLNPSE